MVCTVQSVGCTVQLLLGLLPAHENTLTHATMLPKPPATRT